MSPIEFAVIEQFAKNIFPSRVICRGDVNGNSRATLLISHWCVNEIMILRASRFITSAIFHVKAFSTKRATVREKIIAGDLYFGVVKKR